MKEIIDVLQLWANYQKGHANSTFEDFCRYHLASGKIKRMPVPKGAGPTDDDGMFMMTVSRSTLAFWVYMRIALKDTPLPTIEDIMLCASIINMGEGRKTDVINFAMMEISTGTDNLNRLIRKGFVTQRVDPQDKRSKLLKISKSGLSAFRHCITKAKMAREIFLAGVADEDKKLVTSILFPLQEKQSMLSVANKGKDIEAIYEEVIGKGTRKRS
jgi:DNA-binding MarR family transcriptional regulator